MTEAPTPPPVRIRPEIAALPAYKQGRQAGADAFKLSSNENPFEPLPSVVEALRTVTSVNRYPDASASRLRARLAARFGVGADSVHVAAGSVSILQQLALATCGPGDELMYAWRSFEAYPGLAAVAGATAIAVPLTADGAHDLDAMADAVTERTRMVLVCSPNNPTGPIVTQRDFEAFLDRLPRDLLVVLDEAYAEFVTDPAAVDGGRVLAAGHPNVVVLRTFSKAYGLAGLRIGYGVGNPRVLDAARTTGIPLSVTAQAEGAALASLDAEDELIARVAVITDRRDRLASILREIGWNVPEAQGNFVWLPAAEYTLEVAPRFEDAGLVVRPFAGDGVRISVGEEESLPDIAEAAASALSLLPADHPARRR
ncbi:histidinol-phosphate transaminase [Microbacterium sp. zg.Y1090]|uniref:histidinol-phosphate transaminase n=1 Tax=Microbacterium TaxID=33882 RepID=UPI00214B1A0E|nr:MULTISPECIES: histidinol-phosphate transaminase [unclassified Microbacterium]MCR2814001.1 histidinol-phosphate transaminase [Microbacterium sp. zg.Y1084]MCR2819275.1 histidinol-phosphate transaminase [Microbacterium sp. zg.Y1090]MDL5487192.1 histidinol-phosphate transaminase [Microbacterium sp. zg-Y1211]WIM28257.1 histidinol-phosphate transaminase [Microbacterium sp. zg-Y1090]